MSLYLGFDSSVKLVIKYIDLHLMIVKPATFISPCLLCNHTY